MRILLIGGGVQPIPPTGYGGVERVLADFQTALLAAGHEAEEMDRREALRIIEDILERTAVPQG